ncbi:hypothetical protein GCM10023205_55870 [Yinghuangia aomiensis]|uniref:Uncharacterized protein n=1 Tax=Yinghuangia aomiensis TaxID=676205 RepID=A0ABP9HVP9_9ACTN
MVEVSAGANDMYAGSSDSEVKDWQAMPTGAPSWTAVITVTPVQKWPMTWRMRAGSIVTLDMAAPELW